MEEERTLDDLIQEKTEDLNSVIENQELELNEEDSRKIVWQAKDFSIREFASMLQDGDLDLQPEYQRKYVATPKIASKLIESIIMDVPIPVIYLGVFNSGLMNDAVFKFKRYEDASLEYIGINKHEGEVVGLYDTVLSADDYIQIFENEGSL